MTSTAVNARSESPPESPPESWSTRLLKSFEDSAGQIVFGMEDGTVSIFGLVFGVAASAPNAHSVLLAGATGAVAAAVSMMAGTYLDVESENDRQQAAINDRQQRLDSDPEAQLRDERARLADEGFAPKEIDTITSILRGHPDTAAALDSAFELGIAPRAREKPVVQAAWMFVADLLAAFTPVVPFALFSLGRARTVSLVVTLALLIVLGVGRAHLGRRSVIFTTLETIAIAAGAAGAGLLVGLWIS